MLPPRTVCQIAFKSVTSASYASILRYKTVGTYLSNRRLFSNTSKVQGLKPYLLADIGEGITECQIISWSVKPGDKVEQFDPICEVQSDKATVGITSRYEGIIEKLHYEEGELAKVGSPLLDIDAVSEDGDFQVSQESLGSRENHENEIPNPTFDSKNGNNTTPPSPVSATTLDSEAKLAPLASHELSTLVTPAVRRMLKENNISIHSIKGTGKGGRVLKEDVLKYLNTHNGGSSQEPQQSIRSGASTSSAGIEDRRITLSPVQTQMFKSMTASLSIPHFLYTHTVDLTCLLKLREQIQTDPSMSPYLRDKDGSAIKLTILPFVLKALSRAVSKFPILNSVLDASQLDSGERPQLVIKGSHNFGLAVDTPNGLLVPVIRNVQNHSVLSLAVEIARLGNLAREGKLRPEDMAGGTFVISNIGSIGGNVVAPVILSPMTAIVAIGEIHDVPSFETDNEGIENIVKKKQAVLSWSADHRVLDGATVARCAQQAAIWLEKPEYLSATLS